MQCLRKVAFPSFTHWKTRLDRLCPRSPHLSLSLSLCFDLGFCQSLVCLAVSQPCGFTSQSLCDLHTWKLATCFCWMGATSLKEKEKFFSSFPLFLLPRALLKPLRPPNGERTGEERQIQEKLVLGPEGERCTAGSQGESCILKPRGFVFEHLLLL